MKWIEVIRLRSTVQSEDTLGELLQRITALDRVAGLIDIRSYRHSEVGGDASVHLHWECPRCDSRGSAIALHVADALKEIGLVDVSVWVERGEKDE